MRRKPGRIISVSNDKHKQNVIMASPARPLSPHLQIYKHQLTSVLSIMHRMTGIVALLGSLCILVWLVSLAWDVSLYGFLQKIAMSIPVQIIMFFWTLALLYHLCNGIRHMIWDAGKGYSLPEVYKSGKLVVIIACLLTIIIWITK